MSAAELQKDEHDGQGRLGRGLNLGTEQLKISGDEAWFVLGRAPRETVRVWAKAGGGWLSYTKYEALGEKAFANRLDIFSRRDFVKAQAIQRESENKACFSPLQTPPGPG